MTTLSTATFAATRRVPGVRTDNPPAAWLSALRPSLGNEYPCLLLGQIDDVADMTVGKVDAVDDVCELSRQPNQHRSKGKDRMKADELVVELYPIDTFAKATCS